MSTQPTADLLGYLEIIKSKKNNTLAAYIGAHHPLTKRQASPGKAWFVRVSPDYDGKSYLVEAFSTYLQLSAPGAACPNGWERVGSKANVSKSVQAEWAKQSWRENLVGQWVYSHLYKRPKQVAQVLAERQNQKKWAAVFVDKSDDTVNFGAPTEVCKPTPTEAVAAYVSAVEKEIAEEEEYKMEAIQRVDNRVKELQRRIALAHEGLNHPQVRFSS